MTELGAGAALAERIERKVWRRIVVANLVGVIPVNITFLLGARFYKLRFDFPLWLMPIGFAFSYFAALAWSKSQAKRTFRPIAAWVAEGREPNAAEREWTVSHPQRLTIICFWCWVWALLNVVWSVLVFVEPLGIHYLRMFISVVLSAVIACSLTYVVAEDALRPLFAAVLTQETRKPRTVGVMPRLALAWIVGSASYFVLTALIVGAVPLDQVRAYVIGSCFFGLAVGAILTFTGSRSVVRPLDSVRKALDLVEQGNLEVSVPVDDAGEVGHLQASFNRMVAGLRERDRLKQLFSRHVGPDVAQRAVSASELGGSQLEATVMFVDVIGSTTLAAERPPEAVVAMLNALFSAVVEIVGTEGGFVNQFQGDGALCIFGAPQEVPDHAVRAVRAAGSLRKRIVALGEVYPGFDAAIGVSTGLVVAGDVGTEDRYEYTVIGDAANQAARLTEEAKQRPGRVLASEVTIARGGVTDWISCGELTLRGRPTPTLVYEPGEAIKVTRA